MQKDIERPGWIRFSFVFQFRDFQLPVEEWLLLNICGTLYVIWQNNLPNTHTSRRQCRHKVMHSRAWSKPARIRALLERLKGGSQQRNPTLPCAHLQSRVTGWDWFLLKLLGKRWVASGQKAELHVFCFIAGTRGAHKGREGTAQSKYPRTVKLHMATAESTQALSAEPWVSFVPARSWPQGLTISDSPCEWTGPAGARATPEQHLLSLHFSPWFVKSLKSLVQAGTRSRAQESL